MINKICEDLKKIVSVTTDNDSNMVKTIEIIFSLTKHVYCLAQISKNPVNTTDRKRFLDGVCNIVTWFRRSNGGAEKLQQFFSANASKCFQRKIETFNREHIHKVKLAILYIAKSFVLISRTIGCFNKPP